MSGSTGSAEFPIYSSRPETCSNLGKFAKEWVDRHNFDGIDNDWEHPTIPSHGADYVSLLLAARAVLPSPRRLLTSAPLTAKYTISNI
ncbi:hypothetical protein QBC44DRAFT_374263 [Cladorrhinum sp. PSN332]|nr:hypothetical protein QBC44DRAFT_374263 [Cladorrhinum sp. PSN332]